MHDFEIYISILIPHIEYINENKRNYSDNFKLKKKTKYFAEHVFKIKYVNPWVLSTFPLEITHIFFCHVRFSFKY